MKAGQLDARRLIGGAVDDGQEVVFVADEVDLVLLDVHRQRVALGAGVNHRRLFRRQVDHRWIGAGAGGHVQLVGDRIERSEAAAIRLQRVDDGVGVGIDDRDRARPAIHRVDPAAARIEGQILDVGAGLERHHAAAGAADDLHDPEIGKCGVGLAVARIDDDSLGSVGDADFRAGHRDDSEDDCQHRGEVES